MTLPQSFTAAMRGLLGAEAETLFEAIVGGQPVKGVRRNAVKVSPEGFTALYGEDLTPIPYTSDGFYTGGKDAFSGRTPAHHAGLFYVQEPGAQMPVNLLRGERFPRVLELCAAPGGKSGQLAGLAGVLYANEIVYKRALVLKGNLERLGIRNAVVTCDRPEAFALRAPEAFDLVAVDAPCSGEGMFRKEPEALRMHSPEQVAACAARSLSILNAAAECVCGGGKLLYSTCTFNRTENEAVIENFLKARPDFRTLPLPESVRPFVTEGSIPGCARMFPHRLPCEGQFACVLYRSAGGRKDPQRQPAGKSFRDRAFEELFSHVSRLPPWSEPMCVSGRIVLSPPVLTGINTIGTGVTVATAGNFLKPYHSLAVALKAGEAAQTIDFPPEAPELYAYLKGAELSVPFDGWGTVSCGGYPFGLVKGTGGTGKNHYPKGLYNR